MTDEAHLAWDNEQEAIRAAIAGRIHEDEVPKKLANGTSTANKTAIVYQLEVGESSLGQGAIHVWDEITALVDVIVPGTSKAAGRTLQEDIYTALHAQTVLDSLGVGEGLRTGTDSGRFDDRFDWELEVREEEGPASSTGLSEQVPIDLYRVDLTVHWKDGEIGTGVVYYLKAGQVRGAVLWNVWDSVDAARELIKETGEQPLADPEALRGRIPLG